MLVQVIIPSFCAALFAVLTYLPFQNHIKLHGEQASEATNLNLQQCQPIFPRAVDVPAGPSEAAYCDHVFLHRQTGMAYFSCDPTRLSWDARADIWDEQHAQPDQETPGIWVWNTNKESLPRKMYISLPPPGAEPQPPQDLRSSFHPLGIAVTVSHPFFLDVQDEEAKRKEEPPALLVLVINHPKPHASGVVDVFVHDLDQVGGKDSQVLRWIKRIDRVELAAKLDQDDEVPLEVNPFRIAIYDEQHSKSVKREYPKPDHAYDANSIEGETNAEELAKAHVRIPSFFITSLPSPSESSIDSSIFSSYKDFALSLLQPALSKKVQGAPTQVFVHHSSISKTLPARTDGDQVNSWARFPPLLQVWDGNGVKGGSNTSASSLFISSLDAEKSIVSEWEQHWVRGIEGGIKQHKVSIDVADSSERLVNTYTPSFVSFFSQPFTYPIRALAADKIGRFWTAGNLDTLAAEQWIESQRNEYRRRIGSPLYKKPQGPTPPRPAVKLDQTTFLYRNMGRVSAHPWDFYKLASLKKQGIFQRKEFHTFSVFRSAKETKEELETRTKEETWDRGFLPSVPTGMAVDHERGFVVVVGAYEERGVAKCEIPEEWAEK